MSSPIKQIGEFLFGGAPGAGQPMMMPPAAPPAPPPPVQAPTGSPGTYKPEAGPSFLSSAGAAPTRGQVGGKTLLGQ